jgi:hypothetical protein
MDPAASRSRARRVEERLGRFRSLCLDPAQVRASREFHLRHWLEVAQAAIRADHRELFYGGLSPNVESTIADYPDDQLAPAAQTAVLRDLAFMEGHLEAFRDVLKLLESAAGQG